MKSQLSRDVAGRAFDSDAFRVNAAAPDARVAPGAGSPIGEVRPSFDQRIDALLFGVKWREPTIRYGDPDRRSDYEAGHPEPLSDFRRIDADQLASVHAILSGTGLAPELAGFSVQGLTDLNLRYAGPGSGAAAVRFANTSDPGTAYAYVPSEAPVGGDVFFGRSGASPALGNYDHLTIVHETGHALGLKHGHERDFFGATPFALDSMEFSVMTYRSHVGAGLDGYTNEPGGFAQSLMMLDIAALQHLYGADYSTNAGDTVYSWKRATGQTVVDGVAAPAPVENRIFLTVWDGGGIDSYDLSTYRTDLEIDLAPGGASTFSDAQRAYLGGGPNGGFARGNVFNALLHKGDPRSLIENATGGSGADHISGNAAANLLAGNAGNDRLQGFAGADRLIGSEGADALFGGEDDDGLDGGRGRDMLSGGHGADAVTGGVGADILIGGPGRDTFRFLAVDDSAPGARDRLEAGLGAGAFEVPGAAAGDRIDLSGIDANASAGGDQAFVFGAAKGIGRLWVADSGADMLVRANVNASAAWEFELAIAIAGAGAWNFSAADFVL